MRTQRGEAPERVQRKGGDRSDGFSLIEVLLAQSLLSVGLLSIVSLFTLAVWHDTRARVESLAITRAQQKVEALAAQYRAGIPPTSGEEVIRVENLEDVRQGLVTFKVVWTMRAEPRGAWSAQVKVIPWGAPERPMPGAVLSRVLVWRAGWGPLRR